MNIQLITMWYNEEFLAPFFLNHYAWVDKIHIILDADTNDATLLIAKNYPNVEVDLFKFPDMLDDIIKSTVISAKYANIVDADYIIVVDSDEFIFPFNLSSSVKCHIEKHPNDIYFVNLWQIFKHETDLPLDPVVPVYLQRCHGDPDMTKPDNIGYLKPIIAKAGLDIFWGIGNHYIVHNGVKLEWSSRELSRNMSLKTAIDNRNMLQGSHWRIVDVEETIRRKILNRRKRMSNVNLDRGLGAHYHCITENDIIKEYEAHKLDPVVICQRISD